MKTERHATLQRGMVQTTVQRGKMQTTVQPGKMQTTLQRGMVQTTLQRGKMQTTVQPGKMQTTLQRGMGQTTLQRGKMQTTVQPGKMQTTLQRGMGQTTLQRGKMQTTVQPGKMQTTLQRGKGQTTLQRGMVHTTVQPGKIQTTLQRGKMQTTLQGAVLQTTVHRGRHWLLSTSLILLLTVVSFGACDVVTSSSKMIQLAESEGLFLDVLNKYISEEYDNLKELSQFLAERSKAFHLTAGSEHLKRAEHPNGAYLLIKHFTKHWSPLTQTRPGLASRLGNINAGLPTENDYQGSLSSLIRLQRVYMLSVQHMYAGNYSGYEGPALQPEDAFLLGRQAFMDGYLQEAIQWLQLAVDVMRSPKTTSASSSAPGVTPFSLAQTASLLGRAFFFMGNTTKAQEMYALSSEIDPSGGDVMQLKKELDGETATYGHNNRTWHRNMSLLCSRDKERRVPEIRPGHVCRYKAAQGGPYLRYKEEILSVQPFASLFYDVVSDTEISTIKQHIKDKLFRGLVGQGREARVDNIRTSDLGWIHDRELQTSARISERVKIITGLEVDQRDPTGPSSAEAMQVVNYGLGGHYDAHMDPFKNNLVGDAMLENSGSRIATFLIYLSDVEKGGSTVFLKSGISVSPLKGMALFWYNFTPDMEEDELTTHAGCPVLIGQKWIANKWIWTYGNTFRRPCGPQPHSTQLDVERVLQARVANTMVLNTP